MDKIIPFHDRETLAHEAREWLVRLDSDEPLLDQDKQALQLWMARSAAHRQELVRTAEFWDSSNVLTELLIPMHQVASVHRRRHSIWRSMVQLLTLPRGAVVATLSVLLVVTMLSGRFMPLQFDASNGIYASAIGEVREETLADGSVVQMNTDSQVQVEYSEGLRKIRLLRGEAHFEVAHNKSWPFEVYAGNGRVKAVGTAFLVRLGDERLNVIVTDGRVDLALSYVSTHASTQPATHASTQATKNIPSSSKNNAALQADALYTVGSLSQGQGASFGGASSEDQHQLFAQKDIYRQLSWREGYLVFDGEPLSVVVAELNRYLPVRVEITDESLQDIGIGGRFKVGELDALFDVLEVTFNIQVSRVDDQLIQLHSKSRAALP